MKPIKIITLIFVLLQAGCSNNVNSTDSPTLFSGRVIDEAGSPLTGEITITAEGSNFQFSPDIIDNKIEELGENGEFNIMYEGNEEIKKFSIFVAETLNGSIIRFLDIDCGNLNCEDIKPGRTYDNLVLTAR